MKLFDQYDERIYYKDKETKILFEIFYWLKKKIFFKSILREFIERKEKKHEKVIGIDIGANQFCCHRQA